jgi:hypothetical protein
MATNSSRGNPIAAADGPPVQTTSSTPHVPTDLKAAVQQQSVNKTSSSGGSAGLHAGGEDKGAVESGAHVDTLQEIEDAKQDQSVRGTQG